MALKLSLLFILRVAALACQTHEGVLKDGEIVARLHFQGVELGDRLFQLVRVVVFVLQMLQ